MNRLRMAVIGVGHLGRIHARLLGEISQAKLVAVVDPSEEARQRVGAELGVAACASHQELAGRVDAVVLAAPTVHHAKVAVDLLNLGIDVLVEKPLATTTAEADRIVAAASANHRVLQVGHIEQFNPALIAVRRQGLSPRFLEANRTSGYTYRSTDIGAVLDLMIHDIDIVLSMVRSPVVEVRSQVHHVLGPHEDVAHARLAFENGAVASLHASRVSFEACRRLNLYADRAYASVDLGTCQARLVRHDPFTAAVRPATESLSLEQRQQCRDRLFDDVLDLEELAVEPTNALQDELQDFVHAVLNRRPPRVDGPQGRQAMQVAEQVLAAAAQQPARPYRRSA